MRKMLEPQIIAAIVAALGAVAVAFVTGLGNRKNLKTTDLSAFRTSVEEKLGVLEGNQHDVKSDLKVTIHRIAELERKQDAANAVKERLTRAEEREKSNAHRIDKLEGKK